MPTATPTVAASLAHDCLNSVPLGASEALELVESIRPYLEFQSGLSFPNSVKLNLVLIYPRYRGLKESAGNIFLSPI